MSHAESGTFLQFVDRCHLLIFGNEKPLPLQGFEKHAESLYQRLVFLDEH